VKEKSEKELKNKEKNEKRMRKREKERILDLVVLSLWQTRRW